MAIIKYQHQLSTQLAYQDIQYLTPQRTWATIPKDEVETLVRQWGAVSLDVAEAEAHDPKCPTPQLYAKVAAVLQYRQDLNDAARRRLESPEGRAKVNQINADLIAHGNAKIMSGIASGAAAHIQPATMGKQQGHGGGA